MRRAQLMQARERVATSAIRMERDAVMAISVART